MKTFFYRLAFVFCSTLFLASCDLEAPQPTTGGYVLLTKVTTSQGDSREFVYSPDGWLTTLIGNGMLALNENQSSTSTITFDNQGRIATVMTDGPSLDTKNVYHYTADHRLEKLEELINNQVQSYHTFEYDAYKRLTTRYSFYPDAASNSGLSEKNKSTFTYDASGNLLLHTMYQKTTAGTDWQLVQTMKYENYDAMTGVHHLASGYLFTPSILLHKNNPGKVTTTLASGEVRVTTFTYQYNNHKLPVKRVTTPDNGNMFETVYTYKM